MYASDELQRWAGRLCLLVAGALGMMGYYFGNVRFLPVIAGFAILAAVCYVPRAAQPPSLRRSGQHPAI
jgi:hypothetical protein